MKRIGANPVLNLAILALTLFAMNISMAIAAEGIAESPNFGTRPDLRLMKSREDCESSGRNPQGLEPASIIRACRIFPSRDEINQVIQAEERRNECYRKHENSKIALSALDRLCDAEAKKKVRSKDTVECKLSEDRNVAVCGGNSYRLEKGSQIFDRTSRLIQKEMGDEGSAAQGERSRSQGAAAQGR